MSNFRGYSKEERIKIENRANAILKANGPVRCDQGGCHTGHSEFCAVDSAYENAVDQAKDEFYERQCHETMLAESLKARTHVWAPGEGWKHCEN